MDNIYYLHFQINQLDMMTLTKNRSQAIALKDEIKQLTNHLYHITFIENESFADSPESLTSFVVRQNDKLLKRMYHRFKSAMQDYSGNRVVGEGLRKVV